MSAPLIWIGAPLLIGILLLFLRRWKRVNISVAMLCALLLSWLAWQLPLKTPIFLGLGLPGFEVTESLTLLGRQFSLSTGLRPALLMIYFGLFLWLGGAALANADRLFPALGFLISALLTASLAVKPALYAALFVQMVAILSIPVFSPPGTPFNRGVLRFITLQLIGTSLILFGDGLIPATQVATPSSALVWRGVIVTSLGLAMVSAVAPFHSWIPMLAESAPIYATAFILYVLPTASSFLALSYIERFIVAGVAPSFFIGLRLLGALVALFGGLWAFLERQMGRVLAFAALNQLGLSLLALSLGEPSETGSPLIGILFAQRSVQGLSLAVWALALSSFQREAPDLRFRNLQGLARRYPIAAASIFLTTLSLAGLPLLAGFPTHLALWTALLSRSPQLVFIAIAGSLALVGAALRMLTVLVSDPQDSAWRITESPMQVGLLVAGGLMFLVAGLLPQLYYPYFTVMALIFTNPTP